MRKNLMAMILAMVLMTLTPAQASLVCDDSIVRVAAVGDVLIHQAPFRSVIGSPDGFFNLWSKMTGAIMAADISYANLEGPAALGITAAGQDRGDIGFTYDGVVYSGTNFLFNYHPRVIGDLARAGFNVLSLANNHSMDRKSIGVDRTIQAMNKYGMKFTGVKDSVSPERRFWVLTEAKGMKIAWISCAEHLNGLPDSAGQVLKCAGSEILAQVKELRQRPDVDAIVVTPHWGPEYQQQPSQGQRLLAKAFVEAGATAVIGNHPHVLQNFEWIKASDNRAVPVAYSLGNFVSGQGAIAKKTSAVLYLDFKRDFQKTDGKRWTITKVSALPTFRLGAPKYQVVPLVDIGTAVEAWKIVNSTLKAVEILEPKKIPNCR